MDQPNILLLFTDQQRYDTLGTHSPVFRTPAMDRLAAEGCLFENAYSPNPICIPARHNLITGLTARHHGYAANAGHPMQRPLPTLMETLGNHGYHTEAIGKMHFMPMRRHHGFARMQLMEETPRYREDDDYLRYLHANGWGHVRHQHGVRHLLYHQPQRSLIPEEHHGSRWVADRCVEFLRSTPRRPFFLWASWIAPHPPFNVPDAWADLYAGADLPPAIQPPEREQDLPTLTRHQHEYGDFDGSPERFARHRELYHASLAFADCQMQRVLDELDRSGLAENTLVVLTSDHGEMLGDLGLFQKGCPYEGAAHIPMLLRFPDRVEPASRRSEFVDLNDLLPTFLHTAGLEYPGEEELPGESLLESPGRKDRTVQYVESGWVEYQRGASHWAMIRDHRYKYAHYVNGGFEVLIDMQNDPQERVNLARQERTPQEETARTRLRQKLVEYESRWGLEGTVRDGDLFAWDAFDRPADRGPMRNTQLPPWPETLTDAREIETLNSIEQEIREATAQEPTVRFADLDLESWAQRTGLTDLAKRLRSDT